MKKCTGCKVEKPLSEYSKSKARPAGYQCQCKACFAAYTASHREQIAVKVAVYYAANIKKIKEQRATYRASHKEELKEKSVGYQLKYNYGITSEEKKAMEEIQGGRCSICHLVFPLCIDHNHKTGEVRGLLCRQCNIGIGLLQDNPEILLEAYKYLTTIKQRNS